MNADEIGCVRIVMDIFRRLTKTPYFSRATSVISTRTTMGFATISTIALWFSILTRETPIIRVSPRINVNRAFPKVRTGNWRKYHDCSTVIAIFQASEMLAKEISTATVSVMTTTSVPIIDEFMPRISEHIKLLSSIQKAIVRTIRIG